MKPNRFAWIPAVVFSASAIAGMSQPEPSRAAAAPSLATECCAGVQAAAGPVAPVRAAIVKSYGVFIGWAALTTDWRFYGDVPFELDGTLANVKSFTLADLEATGADVIVLSDPAGGLQQFSASEVAALESYLMAGHGIIGTFLVFGWGGGPIDNRAIAPLFGLPGDVSYVLPCCSTPHISNLFNDLVPASRNLMRLPSPAWMSAGFPFTQAPVDDLTWDASDLGDCTPIAESDGFQGVICNYSSGLWRASFISNLPEHAVGPHADNNRQLLYNTVLAVAGR